MKINLKKYNICMGPESEISGSSKDLKPEKIGI